MDTQDQVKITQSYYDSRDADTFYHIIWGGEDIHVGIYREGDSIAQASQRSVRTMLEKIDELKESHHMLDVGAGYGGAARYLAQNRGCRVTCLNLSEVENQRNREKNKAAGLDGKIDVVEGNFEDLPFEDESFDFLWSEDAILHSGRKRKVLEECFRVLKKGGKMVFTDPMQADECPEGVLDPILKRIHLREMGSVKKYKKMAEEIGWTSVESWEMLEQLVNHYSNVLNELNKNHEQMKGEVSADYLDRMKSGLQHWIDGGKKGYLNWGILLLEK